jgi:Rrf2 family protein
MISSRCNYALKAVLELAKREGSGLATISDIARTQRIPARFLEAILVQLKQHGIARSVRGKQGGYALARSASKITVGDVIRVFEASLLKLESESRRKGHKRPHATSVFSDIWHEAETCLVSVFDNANFAHLAERDRKLESGFPGDFVI